MAGGHQDLSSSSIELVGTSSLATSKGPSNATATEACSVKMMRQAVWKNSLLLGLGCLILCMGQYPIITVQSSLNSEQGLGTVSLSVQTAVQIVTCTFLTTGILRRLGCKWAMVMGSLLTMAYISANLYPTWVTLVLTAALAGVGLAILWTACNTYLTKLTQLYADRLGKADAGTVSVKFFGIFFAMVYSSSIFGNVASSFILGLNGSNDTVNGLNQSMAQRFKLPYEPDQICGAMYCNQDLSTNFDPSADGEAQKWSVVGLSNVTSPSLTYLYRPATRSPEKTRVYALCGFCLACSLLASIILALFLDALPTLGISEVPPENDSAWKMLVASIRQLKNVKQLLLLPITFYNGMDHYFLNADFSKAFVTCPLGIEYIGIMAACSGMFSLVSSFIAGWFTSRKTRSLPFIVGALTHLIPAIALLYWTPTQDSNIIIFYVFAAAWGTGTGIWSGQIGAYYGVVFYNNVEPAMANLVLWISLAQMILYGLSHLLCIYVKIYFLMGVLSLGMLGFGIVEGWMMVQHRQERTSQETMKPAVYMESNISS